jgi:hypothetical protein
MKGIDALIIFLLVVTGHWCGFLILRGMRTASSSISSLSNSEGDMSVVLVRENNREGWR